MKHILMTISLSLSAFLLSAQNQYSESESPVNMATGVYYQSGPGSNNALGWDFPYGTKLTVNGSVYRNFELATTNYPSGYLKFRQWDVANSIWSSWRDVLLADANGNVGIGSTSPSAKLDLRNATANVAQDIRSSYGTDHWLSRVSTNGSNWSGFWETSDNIRLILRDDSGNIDVYFRTDGNSYINGGKVGIGTSSPDSKLTVKGDIHAEEVKVDLSVPGPDYVFKKEYDLKSLEEVQKHIDEHGHLPNIPSAQEMEANGIQLGEMSMKLLEKIEELTLYVIELKEEIEELKSEKK